MVIGQVKLTNDGDISVIEPPVVDQKPHRCPMGIENTPPDETSDLGLTFRSDNASVLSMPNLHRAAKPANVKKRASVANYADAAEPSTRRLRRHTREESVVEATANRSTCCGFVSMPRALNFHVCGGDTDGYLERVRRPLPYGRHGCSASASARWRSRRV